MSVLQVTSLQQLNSKLERQVKQQQQQLTHAEQTIMGLMSSKVHAPCRTLWLILTSQLLYSTLSSAFPLLLNGDVNPLYH